MIPNNTWATLDAALPPEVPDAIREDVRRLTAPERQASRVCLAARAAERWIARRNPHDPPDVIPTMARALLFCESRGLYGGGLRDPGGGTERHEAFRGLGTGRRHASDGEAWTAAIAHAAGRVRLDRKLERPALVVDEEHCVLPEHVLEPAECVVFWRREIRHFGPAGSRLPILARLAIELARAEAAAAAATAETDPETA